MVEIMKRCALASAAIVFTLIFILNYLDSKAVLITCLCFVVFLIVSLIIKNKVLIFTTAFCVAASISVFVFGYFFAEHDATYNGMNIEIQATVEQKYSEDWYLIKIDEAKDGIYPIKFNGKVMLFDNSEDIYEEREIISGAVHISAPSKKDLSMPIGYADGAYVEAYSLGQIQSLGFKEATFFDFSYNLRHYIQTVTEKIGGEEGGLTLSLITGDKSYLREDTVIAFNKCGLTHIMAVSGLNLSIITGFGLLILNKLELSRRLRQLLCIGLILFVMTAASFSFSVMRAGIMSAVLLLSCFFNRRSDALNSLSVAVTAICLVNPYAGMDVGFLLSVSATFAIVVIMPLLYRYIYKIKFEPARCLINSFAVCLSATIGVLPIAALVFSSMSLIGVVMSVVANLLVSVILIMGLLLCAVHFIPGVSHIFIYVIKAFAKIFILIVKYCARFEFAVIEFDPLPLIIFIVLILLFGLVQFIPFKEKPRKSILLLFGSIAFVVAFICSAKFTFPQWNFTVSGQNHNLGVYAKSEEELIVLDCTDMTQAKEIKNLIGKYERIKLYILPEYSEDRTEVLKYFSQLNKIEKLILPDIDDKQKYDIIELFKDKNTEVILINGGYSFTQDDLAVSVYECNDTGIIPYLSYNGFGALYLSRSADPSHISILPKADMLVMNGKYLSSIKGIMNVSPSSVTVYNASYGQISSFKLEHKEKDYSVNEVTGKIIAAIENSGRFTVYGETE